MMESAVRDEVVDAKTSVEEPLVAVYASCHCVGMRATSAHFNQEGRNPPSPVH